MLKLAQTTAAICSLSWLAFCPPVHGEDKTSTQRTTFTLEQAVDFALANNPDIQIMHQRIGQSEAKLGEALASFYPDVKVRMLYERTTNPAIAFSMIISQRRLNLNQTSNAFNHPGAIQNFRPEVTATYSLFRGGQDYQAKKAAELGIETAELQASATRNQLIEAVTSSFYGLLAGKEAHNVALRSIDSVQSQLKQTETRFKTGAALKSDVLSLKVQLAEAQDMEIQTANAIELARSGLKTLLGMDNEATFRIAGGASAFKLPTSYPDFKALLDQALAQRPEIAKARKQVEIAQRLLSAAKGAYLPSANAYVSYGYNSPNFTFSSNQSNVTAGVRLEMDIFNGFKTSKKIKKAERKLAEAERTENKVKLSVQNEVKSAHLYLGEAMARVNVTRASIAAAEESLRLVSRQRKAGVVTVTRYIETEVARDQALARDISARYDALRADAELKKSVGTWRME